MAIGAYAERRGLWKTPRHGGSLRADHVAAIAFDSIKMAGFSSDCAQGSRITDGHCRRPATASLAEATLHGASHIEIGFAANRDFRKLLGLAMIATPAPIGVIRTDPIDRRDRTRAPSAPDDQQSSLAVRFHTLGEWPGPHCGPLFSGRRAKRGLDELVFLEMSWQPDRAREYARLVERMRVRRNTRPVPPVFRIGNATAPARALR